jgi:hypothetical protein
MKGCNQISAGLGSTHRKIHDWQNRTASSVTKDTVNYYGKQSIEIQLRIKGQFYQNLNENSRKP